MFCLRSNFQTWLTVMINCLPLVFNWNFLLCQSFAESSVTLWWSFCKSSWNIQRQALCSINTFRFPPQDLFYSFWWQSEQIPLTVGQSDLFESLGECSTARQAVSFAFWLGCQVPKHILPSGHITETVKQPFELYQCEIRILARDTVNLEHSRRNV